MSYLIARLAKVYVVRRKRSPDRSHPVTRVRTQEQARRELRSTDISPFPLYLYDICPLKKRGKTILTFGVE